MDPTAGDSTASSLSDSRRDKKRACAGGESATGSGVPRKQEHREKKGCAFGERETGPGALPRAKNSEPVFYCASERG